MTESTSRDRILKLLALYKKTHPANKRIEILSLLRKGVKNYRGGKFYLICEDPITAKKIVYNNPYCTPISWEHEFSQITDDCPIAWTHESFTLMLDGFSQAMALALLDGFSKGELIKKYESWWFVKIKNGIIRLSKALIDKIK
jgi:hypothetical protein